MTKREGFTHLAKLYGFKCYYNIDTNEIEGTNIFNNFMIDAFIWMDMHLFQYNEGFNIEIIEELK